MRVTIIKSGELEEYCANPERFRVRRVVKDVEEENVVKEERRRMESNNQA